MVFDITFCGEFGSATFGASCASTGQSCEEYVQKNPAAFSEAFWSIRTLDVYKRSSEAEGVSSAETGLNYGTPPNGPNGALRSVGILCLVLGVGGCGATAYFMYKKGAAENASFVDIQKEGLSTFSANLQDGRCVCVRVCQCTHVNLRELEQAEFVTQIRDGLTIRVRTARAQLPMEDKNRESLESETVATADRVAMAALRMDRTWQEHLQQ
eukprot:s10875_g1.t1